MKRFSLHILLFITVYMVQNIRHSFCTKQIIFFQNPFLCERELCQTTIEDLRGGIPFLAQQNILAVGINLRINCLYKLLQKAFYGHIFHPKMRILWQQLSAFADAKKCVKYKDIYKNNFTLQKLSVRNTSILQWFYCLSGLSLHGKVRKSSVWELDWIWFDEFNRVDGTALFVYFYNPYLFYAQTVYLPYITSLDQTEIWE